MSALGSDGTRDDLEQAVRGLARRPLPARRIAIVTMSRDQIDILPSFLAHHLTLVDRIFIVDHRSVDGTREYLALLSARPDYRERIRLFQYDGHAHNQSVIMTALARRAFAEGADWAIAIDGDEFLAAESRAELQDTFTSSRSPVVRFDWINLLPKITDEMLVSGAGFNPSGEFESISGDLPARYGKLAIHRGFAARFPGARVRAGQHKIHPYPESAKLSGEPLGQLLHVPARSIAQVWSKRQNLSETSDFEQVFMRSHREQFIEQGVLAEKLGQGSATAQEVTQLFESVVLPYEPVALREQPRDSWTRRAVKLPRTVVSGPDLVPDPGLPSRRPPTSPASVDAGRNSRESHSKTRVVLRTDGRVTIHKDRIAPLRDAFRRAHVEVWLFGLRGYLARTAFGRLARRLLP